MKCITFTECEQRPDGIRVSTVLLARDAGFLIDGFGSDDESDLGDFAVCLISCLFRF